MGSPLWKRGVRGDFIEILTQFGSEFASASLRNRVALRNDNLLLAFVLIKSQCRGSAEGPIPRLH